MANNALPIAGWFGKIPSLGDFASRRLPQDFVNTWDAWLQRAMMASRARLGERWLDLYLTSPIWRFALMSGVCGNSIWAGVLMSSVDKVGRYYPLTIAIQLDADSEIAAAVFSAQDWYAALERVALSMLDINASLDDLEQGLADLPLSTPPLSDQHHRAQELATWWQTRATAPKTFSLPTPNSLADLFNATACDVLTTTGFGKSLWWASAPPQLHCFSGLPPENYFAVLLEGIAPEKDSGNHPI